MIIYILGFIILCILLLLMYIRIKYKFWALQPVFHFYDIYYWFVNSGIIRKELPDKNRYVNLKNIKTDLFENINQDILKQIIIFIQLNYLRNNDNTFLPQKDNVVPYFVGHNTNTFWSIYWQPDILIDNKNGKTIEEKKIIGVMSSRPLHVKIYNHNKDAIFDVYYVDYLCVDKNWRKKNIAPQIIQTHEYNQSYQNRKICVSLFKREEELTGIIPLTVYKTYCFNMKLWGIPNLLDAKITLLTCDQQNMYYLYNFINEISNQKKWDKQKWDKQKWDITILPEISNLIELVTSKNLWIKMLLIEGNIHAVYIFKKTCTFIEKGKEIISCIASINGTILSENDFIHGFKVALWSIIKENIFYYLVIENISDNNCIIDNISIRTNPMIVSPTAYFFYNFAYNPFKPEKCLIIN